MNKRRERERAYGKEYIRKLFNRGDKQICTYCGFPADCKDHTLSLYARDKGETGEQYLVPACTKCNLKAHKKHFESVYEKLQYLYRMYLKELQQLPLWTADEIEELDDVMKIYITDNMRIREHLEQRVAWGWEIIQEVENK